MKRSIALLLTPALLAVFFLIPAASAQNVTLESVLGAMDKAAAEFKNAQADVQQDQFTKVVNETDTQKGTVYFQRGKNGSLEMMVVFKQPQEKYVLYSGTSLKVYQPSIEQVNEYKLEQHKKEVETFLTLGFGGKGQDLKKTFDVKLVGPETIAGVHTAKLELVPKNEQVRNTASRILLWIDTERGVSVQQQFFEPSGDYRMAKYSNIKINEGLPGDAFKLKTTGKTKVVAP
jgi:outer membrane lipoprotein-sorting protein